MFKYSLFFIVLISFLISSCNKETLSGPEDDQIENYIKTKNITVTEKTTSGLRYILTKTGTGASVKKGQYLNVNYVGKFLTDKKFDSGNFDFQLGAGRVVAGFDEGIAKMKVGEKATIIFPSALGYGAGGQGSIPGNSPLLFDIEVVSAK
jgi:FKBP-type peptidyl-prolyl cis-trans isomerase